MREVSLGAKTWFLAGFLFFFLLAPLAGATSHKDYSFEHSELLKHLINWQEYGPKAFEKAQDENKPVFLVVSAVWCYWCHVYESEDYLYNETVYPKINREFVPVFVDSDKRQDLTRKYLEGGWPSTVFLTPEGERITGFSGPRNPVQLVSMLDQTVSYTKNRVAKQKLLQSIELVSKPIPVLTKPELEFIKNSFVTNAEQSFDSVYGGFGQGQKFPQGLTESFLLEEFEQTKNKSFLGMVEKTVQNQTSTSLLDYKLSDPIEGGYHRYSTKRDWTVPHYEKMLADNAHQIQLLSHLYSVTKKEEYKRLANQTIEYVKTKLSSDQGGFYGSQDADEKYYLLSQEERSKRKPPAIDQTVYLQWNAEMDLALFEAASRLNRPELKILAEKNVDFLFQKMTTQNGALHYYDFSSDSALLDGQLEDNAFLIIVLNRAYQETGNQKYLEKAQQIADYSLKNLYDWTNGGFFERNSSDTTTYAPGENLSLNKPAEFNGAMLYGFAQLYSSTKNLGYLNVVQKSVHLFSNGSYLDNEYYLVKTVQWVQQNKFAEEYENQSRSIAKIQEGGLNSFFLLSPESKKPDFSSSAPIPPVNFVVLLVLAFLAGILSFLSPCSVSILPTYFATTFKTKEKILVRTLAFFLGLGLVLSILGGLAAWIRSQAINQNRFLFAQVSGALIVFLGVLMVFDKGIAGIKLQSNAPQTAKGSFLFGAIFAVGWTPCIGPILIALFALAANSTTVLSGMVLLLVYALGVSVPILLLALTINRLDQKGRVWKILKGKTIPFSLFGFKKDFHSTSLISGFLLILVGTLMLSGYLYALNSFVPTFIQKIEGKIVGLIG